jgi:hypothetical protein
VTSGRFLGTLLPALPSLVFAGTSAPTIPDTPAGHALAAWLEAFNSGDRGDLESFARAHAPWLSVDGQTGLRARTGGYDLVSFEGSGKLWIVFDVKERVRPTAIVGRLAVRSDDPEHISLLSLVPADTKSTEIVLDEAERDRVVEAAARLLQEFYVFPEVGKKTAARLAAQQKRGDYRRIPDGEVFAVRLSDDLTALSGDKHIRVDYFAKEMPPEEPGSLPRPDPRNVVASNCGFEKADHYPPNVGYLKLNAFEEPDLCTSTAVAAMNFLADSDALIIDLRDNHGGAPRMAALISSYLFDGPTHLDDIYNRSENTTEQLWTLPNVPGKKFTGKAVYVLTSGGTFSAAEEFSYDLKSLKRAILIGETSGGGAHTVAPHRIDGHFYIRVPFGRFINPITKTDWEGTGVEPDIRVAAGDALDEALRRARSSP